MRRAGALAGRPTGQRDPRRDGPEAEVRSRGAAAPPAAAGGPQEAEAERRPSVERKRARSRAGAQLEPTINNVTGQRSCA